MKTITEKSIAFFKKETVLSIAAVLAAISMFFVKPNKEYAGYIDFRTLGILLSLMIIMEGFKRTGFFDDIGVALLKHTKKLWQLLLVLVFLCFFFSMFITNDVALLTFVPFTVKILEKCDKQKAMIPTIILQTIAANLGSMMTPIGNPQNLYLYGIMGVSIGKFMLVLLPYTAITLGLLLLSILLIKDKSSEVSAKGTAEENPGQKLVSKQNMLYALLFILALLVVARVVFWGILLAAVVIIVVITDKETLKTVDYALIFTFIAFFVLIGNLGNISAIRDALTRIVEGKEVYVAVLSSQFISNVPATLLLSGFTNDYRSLLIGVNLGGLGTFIASMASLISYKIYAHNYNETKGRYLLLFTVVNVIYLIILLLGYMIIG